MEKSWEDGSKAMTASLSNIVWCMAVKIPIWILRFYNPTCLKRSGFFKDLCDRSGLVGLYDSDDPKLHWFLVISINLTEDSVKPK